MRTYIALDLEATGMQSERDEVIEIGALKFSEDRVVDRWESFVRPSQPIPYKVTQLTGIKQSHVARAPLLKEIAPSLTRFVGNSPIIGQSIELDMSMLARGGVQLKNVQWDTFELATLLVPEAAVYNLRSVATKLGIDPEEGRAHRALADAELTMRVFRALRERIEDLPFEILSEIGRATSRSNWPLKHLFAEVEHEKGRFAFSSGLGSSIRSQLASKGMSDAELDLGFFQPPDDEEEPEGSSYGPEPNAIGYEGRYPIDHTEIESILKPGGAMSTAFEQYEFRPQQVEMAKAVASALNKGHHLIVEAGTGTGKSIGYLLPAILYSLRTGDRVVVSTNTINLQDQLFTKDLPVLHRVLEGSAAGDGGLEPRLRLPRFRSALMKGKRNYLCLRRWYTWRRNPPVSVEELRVMVKVLVWQPQTTTGDRNELLLLNQENEVWNHVCVSEDGCPLYECRVKYKGLCFYDRARIKAHSAHVLVVNHALLLADLANGGGSLPEYNHLIIDEAHNLEDEATEALGFTVNRGLLLKMLDDISVPSSPSASARESYDFLSLLRASLVAEVSQGQSGGKTGPRTRTAITRDLMITVDDIIGKLRPDVDRCREYTSELFAAFITVLDSYSDEYNAYDLRQRITEQVRRHPTWGQAEITWDNLAQRLRSVEDGLGKLVGMLGEPEWDSMPRRASDIPSYTEMLLELRNYLNNVHKMRTDMGAAIANPDEGAVYWLEARVKGGDVALRCAPLHVGSLLDRYLFSAKKTVVLTSATLSTENDFSYICERLGLHTGEDLQLSSPFDYEKSALVYVPDDMPEPGTQGYQRHLEQTLIELCKASQGRALVLFTSHSALRATYRAILRPLEEAGIMVLGHNIDGSRRQLLERFKSNPRTVLLGTSSFWEGIDVVGDALSVLVIAKLPFAVPSDPVFAARSEGFEDAFNQYSVPQAILKFKQGFGRLIRSQNDRGVVAVLDRRISSKRYGQAFLNSLPVCTIKYGPTANLPIEVANWLE